VSGAEADRAAFHEFVAKHHRFLLTTHINPDGDGLGSEVALAHWLLARGKSARILNDSVLPAQFAFMAGDLAIESWQSEMAEQRFGEADALIVLDTSNKQRIGRVAQTIEHHIIPVMVVDHHATHTRGFGRVNVIEPGAAATGEILFELFHEAGHPITPAIAEALYIAVMTDTGSFRYSNTDPHVHRMAAEMLGFGLDPQRLHALVHAHASAGRMRFFGSALAALEMHADGRLVVLTARPEDFQRHGVVGADTDGLVDMPRTIAGVEAVALFSEAETGKTKVSLRSTGRVKVDELASRHGGGGHIHAAGILLRCTTDEARARILPELVRIVEGVAPGESAGAARK